MRFCPFCSAENADELAVCQSCGRRLPPLPPRRARNAPPTGVLLPPRAVTTTQPPPVTAPRRATATNPPVPQGEPLPPGASGLGDPSRAARLGAPSTNPPFGDADRSRSGRTSATAPSSATAPTAPTPGAPPAIAVTSAGLVPVSTTSLGLRPPGAPTATGLPAAPPSHDDSARALAHALSPGPAAQRREPPPSEPPDPGSGARRRSDQPLAPAVPAGTHASRVMPSVANVPRGTQAPALAPPFAAPFASSIATANTLPGNPPDAERGAALANQHAAADPPWAVNPRAPTMLGSDPTGPAQPPQRLPQPQAQPQPQPQAQPQPLPAVAIDPVRPRGDDGIEPPPTRIHRADALVDRPFTPPQVSPIPEIPEPSLVNSARYAMRFAQARWQRRGAIKALGTDIKKDTDALDQVLGALGGVARTAKLDGRVFAGENAAITLAEQRAEQLTREHDDVDARRLEENSKFVDVERERNAKLAEAERMVEEAQKELSQLETQRRGLRDKRKELERRQKAHLKAAEDAEKQTSGPDQGDTRLELRRTAEQARREAAAIEPERQEIDRRLASIERPINEATARLDAAKAELDAAKRSLADAREGHTHRLAELDAEQKRKAREIAQAQGEIARRLVTLGTLVNLNRIEDPQFDELYQRIDRLRGAITARTTEIEKLTAEREAYDRGTLVRGVATIGGAIIVLIALIVILRAALSH
jgi:hypothetical protein